MNLTRMRAARWLDDIIQHYNKYRYDITWGDQDLINIYFHFYPGKSAFSVRLCLCFFL
jgi:UDP-xylose:glucoside alpha-1,3-xylosyltransferase